MIVNTANTILELYKTAKPHLTTEQTTEEQMQEILFGFADRAKSIAVFVALGTEAARLANERENTGA